MSKIIDLKAYHLSELGKESQYSADIEKLLGKVSHFKDLDLTLALNECKDSLTEALSLKLLDELDVVFGLIDSSKLEKLEFLKRLIDLKPVLVAVGVELMGRIEEKLLEKLDEMINKVNHSQNDKVKPGLPSRNNMGASVDPSKVVKMSTAAVNAEPKKEQSSSNAAPTESKLISPEKGTPPQKKGAFSKMLTHLTKARPKANRSKKNESSMSSQESLGVSKEEIQDVESGAQKHGDQTLDQQSKEEELPASAISSLVGVLNQGASDADKLEKNNVSPGKESPLQGPVDGSPTKPIRPKVEGSETGKPPVVAPRPPRKRTDSFDGQKVESENVNVSPSKPKVAARPLNSLNQEVPQISPESKISPNESRSPVSKSSADGYFGDVETRRISSLSFDSSVNTGEVSKSDILTSSQTSPLDQVKRPTSLVEEHSPDGKPQEQSPISPPKRIPGVSGQHSAIGALAAAVTGRKMPAAEMPTLNTAEPQPDAPTEARVAPKPTPPKRPVKNIANDSQKLTPAETEVPVPIPRTGSNEKVSTNRPQSDVVMHTEDTSPIEIKRPMSMIDDYEIREESGAQAIAPPKRIPGVFATQHGAIGALAAAVTGRRNNSLNSNSDHASSAAGSRDNSITQAAVSLENAPDSVSGTADEISEQINASSEYSKASSPLPAMKSNSFISNPPMTFKKKDASLSGDDKGIEKSALDWLNQHLASRDIHIDNLYDSLKDGLNLIYAIEDAMKESVGKYNKKTMLPVHKIDNLSVALSFLNKKGVDIQFITPQDIMDGNKGKILTLFVGILKL